MAPSAADAAFPTLLGRRASTGTEVQEHSTGTKEDVPAAPQCRIPLPGSPEALLPGLLQEVTAAFIEQALRAGGALPDGVAVEAVEVTPTAISGFLSTTGRVAVRYSRTASDDGSAAYPPPSLIVKLQAENETNREIALGADNYGMERRVYKELAGNLSVGTPRVYQILTDDASDNVVFVMEDLCLTKSLYSVSQFAPGGVGLSEAVSVAQALGKLHAQFWTWPGDDELAAGVLPLPAWLPEALDIEARDPVGLARDCRHCLDSSYCRGFDAQVLEALAGVAERAPELGRALRRGPMTFLHNDLRADNLFWGAAGVPGGVMILDWQMVGRGAGPLDLAWFSSSSFLEPGASARLEDNRLLLEVYWKSLIEAGVDAERYPLEAAWRDYLLGFVWSFLVVMQVVKFGLGLPPLELWFRRAAAALLELGADRVPLARLA